MAEDGYDPIREDLKGVPCWGWQYKGGMPKTISLLFTGWCYDAGIKHAPTTA